MKETIQIINTLYNAILQGQLDNLTAPNLVASMNEIALLVISNPNMLKDNEMLECVNKIIRISNIAYNNTSADVLPLDDGVYDQLLVVYKEYDKNYQVGATPTIIMENSNNSFHDSKIMVNSIDNYEYGYIEEILQQRTPMNHIQTRSMVSYKQDPITKRMINTTHKYPELVGTLDKCKFVLNEEAKSKGVFNTPSVQIFERDFIGKCIMNNIITPEEKFRLLLELKYDGVSVEMEVCGDQVISALSRGDTSDNVATDLTPIFKNYRFPRAKDVPKDITFGIKFEAVITKLNLSRLGRFRGREYKNCRNAIIGLLSSVDAYKYTDLITLIPLASSLDFGDDSNGNHRIKELEFLNKYYSSGEYNRFCVTPEGNYVTQLASVNMFTKSAESVRAVLPYMIDGVVISFIDIDKITRLGRENSVNKYQMAIKFNPSKVRTIFLGYTYNIGKSGDVIPMVHFKPCEFIGTIHTKQTLHSYARFKELNLKIGEQIDVEYVNDVLTYITKPDNEYNRNLKAEPVEFIKKCPYCGGDIVISETGKTARCINPSCHEKKIMRMVDMVSRLGLVDFAEERIRALDLVDLKSLLELPNRREEVISIFGPIMGSKILDQIVNLKNVEFPDYRLLSALSFEGMADEKWKTVLKVYTIQELYDKSIYDVNHPELFDAFIKSLNSINGIGDKVAKSIVLGLNTYNKDIKSFIDNFKIINSKGQEAKPKIVITGFRDSSFVDMVNAHGFDCSDKYSLTKDTFALVAANPNESTGKLQKAKSYGIPIYSRDEFISHYNIL